LSLVLGAEPRADLAARTGGSADGQRSLRDLSQWAGDLGSDEFRVRQRASRCLLRAGARSLPFLAKAVRSPDTEVSQRAIDVVLALCHSNDNAVVWAARDELLRLADNRGHPAASRAARALRLLNAELEKRAVDELERQGAVVYELEEGYRVTLGRSFRGGPDGWALIGFLPSVVSLTVQQTEVSDAMLAQLRDRREMEILSLMEVDVEDDDLEFLSRLARLKSLHLVRTRVTSDGLARVRGLTELVNLSLQNCPQVTDQGLAHLAGLVKLRTLDLSRTGISDAGLACLKSLSSLESLNLSETRISQSGLRQLDLRSLTQLELRSTDVGDEGLEVLQRVSPDFTYLDAEGTAIGDGGLAHLSNVKNIWYLNLSDTRVTDKGLVNLAGLTQLRTLQLSGTQVTGSGLSELDPHEISELKLDHTLLDDAGLAQLRGHRVRALGLQYTRITDRGLGSLEDLDQLDWLFLDGTQISDAGLDQLASLEDLRGLSLAETNVTEEAVAELEKTLFKCRISR
jgi:Leucine-rich repeat (LRR) protein